jgi:hypothetical protein
MRARSLMAIGTLLAALAAMPAHATVYDAVQGFSLSNPSGVWSYSYAGTPFSTAVPTPNTLGVPYWWTGQGVPNSAIVGQNVSGGTVTYLTIQDPNNTLWIDPESWSNVAVTFTAPAAGNYTVNGDFLGIDTGERTHGVEALVNGLPFYLNTISAYGASDPFGAIVPLTAGGTISFLVDGGSLDNCGFCNLSTALTVQISTVPEPAGWAMMLTGFFALGAALRRSRRKGAHLAA